MAEIVLFHHALGLTPGVAAFADRLRSSGHTVHTPDLFGGTIFSTIDEGVGHVSDIGFDVFLARGSAAVESLSDDVVYAGMSLGVLPAQQLTQTRARARGALLLHACVPVTEFSPSWPANVPVQIHAKEQDPFFVEDGDIDSARALVAEAPGAELFLYPGDQHLFTDSSLDMYDEVATDLVLERAEVMLSGLG
jgi:dienelactone hydrolase